MDFSYLLRALTCLSLIATCAYPSPSVAADNGQSGEWRSSQWLGDFYVADELPGWILHEGIGWLYAHSDPTQGDSWFYGIGFGHLWSGSRAFPWLYCHKESDWVYYYPGTGDPAFYYHPKDCTWKVGPTEFLSIRHASEMVYTAIDASPPFGRIGRLQRITPYLEFRDVGASLHGGIQVRDLPLQAEANIRRGQHVEIRGAWEANTRFQMLESPAFLNIGTGGEVYNIGLDPNDTIRIAWWDGDYGRLYPLPQASVHSVWGSEKAVIDLYSGSFLNPGRYHVRIGLIGSNYVVTPVEDLVLTVNRMAPPEVRGTIVADSGFRPSPDGFGFPNYSDIQPTDLSEADVQFLLGDSANWVGANGDLVLKATTRQITGPILEMMSGGHCLGMAIAGSRLFQSGSVPAAAALTVDAIDSGAEEAIDLQKFQMRKLIAVDMAIQLASPFFMNEILATGLRGPTAVLNFLRERFSAGETVPAVCMSVAGSGHAVTPYAVTDEGSGIYRIYCWDNNFPDDFTLVIEVNTNRDTWTFFSTDPLVGVPYPGFEGDAASANLCYIDWGMIENYRPGTVPGKVSISATADTRMLVANTGGDQIGYDFEQGAFVDEYPGATILPIFEFSKSPRYFIPIPEGSETLPADVDIDEVFAQLIAVEVGLPPDSARAALPLKISFKSESFVKTISGLTAAKGETFVVLTHPSGRAFMVDGEEVDISGIRFEFAINDDPKQRGYIFDIHGIDAPEDSSIMVLIDSEFEPLILSIPIEGEVAVLDPGSYTASRKRVGVGIAD